MTRHERRNLLCIAGTLGEGGGSQKSAHRGRTMFVSAVITSPPGLLQREKKNTRLSFPLKTNVYINVDNRERARARNK